MQMPSHESCRVGFPLNAARPPAPIPDGAAPAVSGGAGKLAAGTAQPCSGGQHGRLSSREVASQAGSKPADYRANRAFKPLNSDPDVGVAATSCSGGCSCAGSRVDPAGGEAGTVLLTPCNMVPPTHGAFEHSWRCTDTLDNL